MGIYPPLNVIFLDGFIRYWQWPFSMFLNTGFIYPLMGHFWCIPISGRNKIGSIEKGLLFGNPFLLESTFFLFRNFTQSIG